MGRGRTAGFADANADAREQQLPEILCHPAKGGEKRPDRDCPHDHIAAVGAIGQRTERQTYSSINYSTRTPGKEADRGVTAMGLTPNGISKRRTNTTSPEGSNGKR